MPGLPSFIPITPRSTSRAPPGCRRPTTSSTRAWPCGPAGSEPTPPLSPRQHRSRYGPAVRAIPWGADPREPPPARICRSGELNVLFVGQMRPYKGVETLLAAAAGQSWLKLTLVGDGAEFARYRRLAERLRV